MTSPATTIVPPASARTSRAPSLVNSERKVAEKEGHEKRTGDTTADESAPEEGTVQDGDDADYPSGFRLTAVVLALVLSIFLVALDMVRSSQPPLVARLPCVCHRLVTC